MESLILEANKNDINSYSNFDKILQKHMNIDATFDLYKQTFIGDVIITFEIIDKSEKKIILDCKCLQINKVEILESKKILQHVIYSKNEDKEALGTPLIIFIPDDYNENTINKKCPEYLDKQWYIDEAIKRLESFGIKYKSQVGN